MKGLTKVRAGLYRHDATGRLIVYTRGAYNGPRGGEIRGWEHAVEDRVGTYTIDSWTIFPTLREAVADLEPREPAA